MRGHQRTPVPIPEVFARLIEIGEAVDRDELRVQQLLPAVVRDEPINRYLPQGYLSAARKLTSRDLDLLIRGFVTAESRLCWLGGSAAMGIRLFHLLDEQDPGKADLLGDWILRHEYNPYLPCGWIREGTSTMEQYRQIPARREARQRRHEENCLNRHVESLRRRQARQARGETRVAAQKAASVLRKDLLERLSLLSAAERLTYVVSDMNHGPQYYPDHYASLSSEQIQSLAPVLRERLIDRLATIRRGVWKNLHRLLQEVQSP